MKKALMFSIATFSFICLCAQPPMGGGGRPDSPPRGDMMQRPSDSSDEKITLEVFPEIPNLSLEQREKVGSILTKEMKDVSKQLKKKRELMPGRDSELSEKDLQKNKEKADKIDQKIASIKDKSNNKVKKELSDDQYQVFIEKREEFKFKHHRENFRMRMKTNNIEMPQQSPMDRNGGPEDMF